MIRIRRLCLRVGVEPVFIPKGKPQHNGSVEHFNGWFHPYSCVGPSVGLAMSGGNCVG